MRITLNNNVTLDRGFGMLNVAIVDDNDKYIIDIKKLLKEFMSDFSYKIFEYNSADEFVDTLNEVQYDVIFLDIILGQNNGIDIGKIINKQQPEADIIFISVNQEYFKDVYRVNHSYFLIKDFEKDRFSDAIKKIISNKNRHYLTIQTKHDNCNIFLNDVLYFEGYLKHTKIYMSNGDVQEFSTNLKDIEKKLPSSSFIRVHQSFIVNLNHIKQYSRKSVFFSEECEVPISRSYTTAAREKITLFLGGAV